MSSHHFVKEQQEPALLILNTAGISFEQIAPLLEWVPTILVVQDEVPVVISWGVKIDLILAEMDFQKSHYHLLEEQYPVKFLGVQEENFLEEGLQYLIASKHGAVNIIGLDHLKVFELEPMLEFLDIVVWDGPIRYFPIKNGQFKKWLPATSLQLHAPEGTILEVQTPEGNEMVQVKHATFIEVEEGTTIIKGNGIFWIGEFMNT
ncbi:thiamine pyrophosphokinase [Aquiflexum gelatinilyticum]|uniref:Thiamine pyrophosphokinase n=1 Tax=Aquiflexum gelatinilyticum TaxID=2961943 RepID=A0A9X2P3C5_9BACT|nr:thiamine pyrophosphokinase [Aquiflexum gelatinilyticum]MCR9014332.1 thiamine pyrophosphokinase [Aquiflexum gelatinilyticum]